jgi:hypothetical protein
MKKAMTYTDKARREALIAYLLVKADEADWHAVADVACDLRELEAKHPELRAK